MADTIYRQDAIDALGEEPEVWEYDDEYGMGQRSEWCYIKKTLEKLPSAQPERKGKWIKLDMHAHLADHKCTACGQECYVPTCMGEPMYTYCPNCGAKMDGGKE